MVMMARFPAAHPAEKFLGPIGTSAVEAVGSSWLTRFISYVACNASQELPSSALMIVPLAMRERMKESACPSVRNTAGSERPLRRG